MIVTIFGGSAPGTPALLSFIAERIQGRTLRVRLVGRSAERLQAVVRAAKLLMPDHSIMVETFQSDGRPERYLRGADVVLIQARFGGLEGRLFDESFPVRYGLCGDEGLGPGGLSAAWRSWPPLKQVVAAIHREAPEAFVLLLTSPVTLLTRLACASFPGLRFAGICELPWTTLQEICSSIGVMWDKVSYCYSGINHIGWFWRISVASRDVIEEYASRRENAASFPSAELIRAHQAVPLKYLRLHYESEQVWAEQRRSQPRSSTLIKIAELAVRTFRESGREQIRNVLQLRPTPWYEHAVGPLLVALSTGEAAIPFFLSTPDAAGDVRETPHEFRGGELKAIANGPALSPEIGNILESFVAYDRVAADAVREQDEAKLARALEKHPWIQNRQISSRMIAREIATSS